MKRTYAFPAIFSGVVVLLLIITIAGFAQETTSTPQLCQLTAGSDVTAYTQPSTSASVYATLNAGDTAIIVGELSDGWYAWSNPGAQAGSTGTYNLRWIQMGEAVEISGDCSQLPTFYPFPNITDEICTLLATESGKAYVQPDIGSESTDLAGMMVQVLAQTANEWYGYDPGDAQNETVGVTRLRWIPSGDAQHISGDCRDIPTVNAVPMQLSPEDKNRSVTVSVGDTIQIMLPASGASTSQWSQAATDTATNNPAVVQLQGTPHFGPSGDRFGANGALTLTYQAVAAGETRISLMYQGASTIAALNGDTFAVEVTVTDSQPNS